MSSDPRHTIPSVPAVQGHSMPKVRRILLAEDDAEMRRVVSDWLGREGYDVIEVNDGGQLLLRLVRELHGRMVWDDAIDLILTDVRMPGRNGLDVIESLRTALRETPVIVMTAFGDRETRALAAKLRAVLLDKPFRREELVTVVREALS
jgi:CheY-like chemotaxis protein